MSGVLRLDQAAQLWHGGAAIREAWVGGKRVWPGPLVDYYGTGAGQIPIDLRFDAASSLGVTQDDKVLSVQNMGGAGSVFDLMAAEGSAPTWDSANGCLAFSGSNIMTMRNPAALDGVHFLVAAKFSQNFGRTLLGGNAPNDPFLTAKYDGKINFSAYHQASNLAVGTGRTGGYDVVNWNIAEFRYVSGVLGIYLRGVRLASLAFAPPGGFPVRHIGGAVGYAGAQSSGNFIGALGQSISVVCDPAAGPNPAALEPAVIAARKVLAARYGVALA